MRMKRLCSKRRRPMKAGNFVQLLQEQEEAAAPGGGSRGRWLTGQEEEAGGGCRGCRGTAP